MSDQNVPRDYAPYRRTKVFISYRRADGAGDAERLYDELKRYFAARQLFLDVKSIRRGDRFPLAIAAALDACPALLAVIGPRWLGASDEQGRRRLDDPSDLVRREISAALARGVWVIPVLLYGTPMPGAEDLPEELKQLAECQAVEIRSGYWETGVRELAGLLKRRLRRGLRPALALSTAAALIAVVVLLYRFAFAPAPSAPQTPVDLKAGDDAAVLRVNYEDKEEERREIVAEGLEAGDVRELLTHDGKPPSDVTASFDSARFDDKSVKALELSEEWGKGWGRVTYTGMPDADVKSLDASRACRTSITVGGVPGAAPPASLRIFQEKAGADSYREVSMQSDGELLIHLGVTGEGGVTGTNGFGCSKQIIFGKAPRVIKTDPSADLHARGDTRLSFRFMRMRPPNNIPLPPDWLQLTRDSTLEPFPPRATRLRARRVMIRSRQGQTISYDARAADDRSSLRLHSLVIGPDYIKLVIEGTAYVTKRAEHAPPGLAERVRQNRSRVMLLLATALGLFVCFLYALVKL